MEGDSLLQALGASRRRFQKQMQRLFAKYDQAFEDAPVVQMTTLTYQTPQGLRIWGGRLVKEMNQGQIQMVDRNEDPVQASASGSPPPCMLEGADVDSCDMEATFSQEHRDAGTLEPVLLLSPLKNELRRKYLTQVDLLLREDCCAEGTNDGEEKDTPGALVHSPTSPSSPACGCNRCVAAESPGGLSQLPSPPGENHVPSPHSSDTASVPRSDRPSFPGACGHSLKHGQSLEADDSDICNVTISELYAGMLHSMSRLLGSKPSCIISTKTSILRHWGSRGRAKHRSRLNKTFCRVGRPPRRTLKGTPPPTSEPAQERGPLRDCQNLLPVTGHETNFQMDTALLEAGPAQLHRVSPVWGELEKNPQKYPPLARRDPRAGRHHDQENPYVTLKSLISPVKIVSKRGFLQSEGRSRSREIEVQFNHLYQDFSLHPRAVPMLLPGPSAVEVYSGGSPSSRVPPAFGSHQLGTPIRKTSSKRLSKTFENPGSGRCREAGAHFSPSSSKMEAVQSLGLRVSGTDLGMFQKSVSPRRTLSLPLNWGREHYEDIKASFDRLHQKYCQKSPRQPEAPSCSGSAPERASVEAPHPRGDWLGQSKPGSGCQGPPRLSWPQWHIKSPLCPTVEAPLSALLPVARIGPDSPAKRPRLSDPHGYGRWAGSHSSQTSRRAGPVVLEEAGSLSPNGGERKRKERPVF